MKKIYTIGYQGKTIDQLIDSLKARSVELLVDVRSRPYGRKKEFNRESLHRSLSENRICYIWAGETLGGFGKIDDSAIHSLALLVEDTTICIMCMEKDHQKCHRSYEIARRVMEQHGIIAIHI